MMVYFGHEANTPHNCELRLTEADIILAVLKTAREKLHNSFKLYENITEV